MSESMHPEDIKAGIRKRYGTITAFEQAKGLPEKSVSEILRGRTWRKISDAVSQALQEPVPSELSDNPSSHGRVSHRLNVEAR